MRIKTKLIRVDIELADEIRKIAVEKNTKLTNASNEAAKIIRLNKRRIIKF